MRNLAGDKDCDQYIRDELTRCKIDIIESPKSNGHEVNAKLTGKLGEFTFKRDWYYWVVSGPMPIEVARELYADPVGKTDIRVDGHCGCPSPDDYGVTWFTSDGKPIWKESNREQYEKYYKGSFKEPFFSDTPETVPGAEGVIESYHIDSELGLYIFVQALKRHGLV